MSYRLKAYFSLKNLYLFLIFIFFSTTTFYWIYTDRSAYEWDQTYYLTGAESLYKTFQNEGLAPFLIETTTILARKAPLISILPFPVFLFLGSSLQNALLVNLFFYLFFCIFFYLLISNLINRQTAVISVLITSLMPLFYGLMRKFYVEFGLMTISVIWVYLLVKSERLTKVKYLILMGFILGLGELMKFHFVLFIIGPLIYVLIQKLKLREINFAWAIRTFEYVTIPSLLVAGPWYSKNILTVLWHAKRASDSQLLGPYYYGPIFSFTTLNKIFWDFVNYSISGYFFLVLSFLLFFSILRRLRFKINFFLVCWFLIPFLIFFLGPNKDYRLLLPVLPIVSVFITSLYLKCFKGRDFYFLLFIIFIPTVVYLNNIFSTNIFFLRKEAIGNLVIYDFKIGHYIEKPKKEFWPNAEILTYLDDLPGQNESKFIVLGSEDAGFNINTLQYFAIKNKLNLKVSSSAYLPNNPNIPKIISNIESADYFIMKVGVANRPADINRYNDLILANINYRKWVKIKNEFTFPDNGKLLILKKI